MLSQHRGAPKPLFPIQKCLLWGTPIFDHYVFAHSYACISVCLIWTRYQQKIRTWHCGIRKFTRKLLQPRHFTDNTVCRKNYIVNPCKHADRCLRLVHYLRVQDASLVYYLGFCDKKQYSRDSCNKINMVLSFHIWKIVMIVNGWRCLRHVLMLQHISCQPS